MVLVNKPVLSKLMCISIVTRSFNLMGDCDLKFPKIVMIFKRTGNRIRLIC